MKHNLAYYPNDILRKKAERVNYIDDALRQLVHEMIITMHSKRGIGLAAPQIFHSISLFVACVPVQKDDGKWVRGENRVFINPQIENVSLETQLSEEGCLSIPNVPVTIERPFSIEIRATNLLGQTVDETLEGLRAANFLHEFDHLQGKLIIDYLSDEELKRIEPFLKQLNH